MGIDSISKSMMIYEWINENKFEENVFKRFEIKKIA